MDDYPTRGLEVPGRFGNLERVQGLVGLVAQGVDLIHSRVWSCEAKDCEGSSYLLGG